jgi:hypothetical protein
LLKEKTMNRRTTQLLAVLLVVTLSVALYTPGVTRAQEAVKGMGLIPSSPARYAPALPPGLKVGKVPAAVDLSSGLPPVGDQGSQDSSVAWATTYYYKTFQEEQERAWGVGTADHQFSPAMTYNLRTRFTPNACSVDEGMRFPDAMDILLYDGALPLATFPYSDTDTCTQPTAPQLADAATYSSLGYGAFFVYGEEGNVTEAQVGALKAHLAGGDLLVMGIPVYEPSFSQPISDIVGVPGVGETLEGFHAVTVVGYDDEVGGFKFINSWGPSYAGDGYAYLSYEFVLGHALEAWWMWDRLAAPAEGCVEGTVRDIGGDPVADVVITLDGPTTWTGTTNISGTFATGPILPLGTYMISASKPGFAFTPGSAEIVVSEGACAVQDFVATEAVLWVDPAQDMLFCGETTTISINIRDVVNLYGVQFDLTFDPNVIEVIDADGDPGNGIIVPGDIFPPNEYEVAYEQVDNVGGLVEFAISLLRVPKAPPFAGSGTVAEITVRGLADGVSPLVLLDAKLANSEGQPIDALTEDSSITVECQTAVLGYAYLESRTVHDGITVTLEGAGLSTTTDANGAYAINGVPSGTYTVTFEYDEFLDVEVGGVVVVDGLITELCGYTLLAGDLNDDEVVDILDLSLCASEFGSTSPDADVNADGIVDIYDLVLIGKNFKLASPQPGVCTP